MTFNDKLKHNFWALSNKDKFLYLLFIRPFQSKKDRVFFDGSFFLPGQMYKAERKGLYDVVRESKPDHCFEIGTYTGGGSTLFISKALKDNGKGILHTMESDEPLYNKAKNRYRKYIKHNSPFIDFIHSSSPDAFKNFLDDKSAKIMIFLDGAEDGAQTLEQYTFFKPYFKKDTILALHDWNTEKTIEVKPAILEDHHWLKVMELDKPESVGFAVFKYQ